MEVKEYELKENINVFYVQAESFPEGISASFNKLNELLGKKYDHHIYGITLCDGDKLVYYACAKENFVGEAESLGLPTFTIPNGRYLQTTLNKWPENLGKIPGIFDELMAQPQVKKQSLCVEDYITEDTMLALVQLA
ncbi:MAG: hypothetical protein ACXVAY_08585 [Mucilaginibacter sp.]